jgi:hypothetical protein
MGSLRRSLRRLSSVLILAAWIAGLVAPAVSAHGAVDLECGDAPWLSDHDRTAFEDVRPPVETGHCELCHLQRALRGALASSAIYAWIPIERNPHLRSAERGIRSADRSSLPPRAPPTLA